MGKKSGAFSLLTCHKSKHHHTLTGKETSRFGRVTHVFLRVFEEAHHILESCTELLVLFHLRTHPDRKLVTRLLGTEPGGQTSENQ